MRVRIVTNSTFPDGQAATSRVRCYSKALAHAGNDVSVLAFTNLESVPGSKFFAQARNDDIEFLLISNRGSQKRFLLKHLTAILSPFVLAFCAIATARRHDVFIVYMSTTLSRFLLLIALRALNKKTVIELNEFPYATEGGRALRIPMVRTLARRIALNFVLPRADGVLAISDSLCRVAKEHAPNVATLKVPILGEWLPDPSRRGKAGGDELYIFHAGSLSEQKDGITAVFKAFALAHHLIYQRSGKRLKLYLTNMVTQSETLKRLTALLEQERLANEIVITGHCSEGSLKEYLQGALALVINKPLNLQNSHNFPTKLGNYLASGRPVILAGQDSEANKYLLDEQNALVVPSNDANAIAQAIVKCYEDPAMAMRIGSRGSQTYSEKFHYAGQAQSLSHFIRTL